VHALGMKSAVPHFFSVGGVNWTIAVNMSRLTENLENRTPVGL